MKNMIWASLGFAVVLSGCAPSGGHYAMSSNVKGCGTVGCAQVPAVRIPAVIMPTGSCEGGCHAPARTRHVQHYVSEPSVYVRESMYPKTYESYCAPRM